MIIHTHTTSHYIKKTSITIIKSTLSIIDNNLKNPLNKKNLDTDCQFYERSLAHQFQKFTCF